MTIKRKLFLLVALLLVAVAGVGTVGFFAVRMVSGKIYYLTRESSPLQVKMVNLQQGFEKVAANFTQMALTTSAAELAAIRKDTDKALSQVNATVQDLTKLKAGIDEKVVEDIEKAYKQLTIMGEERLQCMNKVAAANEQLRSGIAGVVGEVGRLDAAMQRMQKESYASVEKSKEASLKANTLIKRMLVIQDRLSSARALIMQIDTVFNRFKLNPLKDKMRAEVDRMRAEADGIEMAIGKGGLAGQLKEFVEEIEKGFSGDAGLLAARASIIADPTSDALSQAYEKKSGEMTKKIEGLGNKLAGEIDKLDLVVPQENQKMGNSIRLVTSVGHISGASANIAILARTIESTSKQIMLAGSADEAGNLRTRLEGQFAAVARELGGIRNGLGSIRAGAQAATVKNVESAFAGMRGLLLSKDGILDQILKNLATQARSAQIFSEAKKLIERIGQASAEKTRSAEAGQEKAVEAVEKVAAMTTTALAIAGIISIAFGIIVGGWISRSINTYLERVISGLNDSSGQVSSAAGEVSGASQQLAEGASEQAAALEQTSASLEEITSMTRQNADNAQQANMLMEESRQVVEKANSSMSQMSTSMHNISAAGEEIGKIIKTIDGIAFQTNLLALNAAVEAARAGEAGMGFAVVAEEVRNLAKRAAEAAKNTSNLIEDVIQKIAEGSGLVSGTEADFREVATSAKKVANLVAEIAAASREQSQGMDQISNALGQMDQVVQKNAANAEETASASEELNAQAHTLQDYVDQLSELVGGKNIKTMEGGQEPDDSPRASFVKKLHGIRKLNSGA
ncbi:MAG: methyl-accepting chemotaxis protein [Thermodesulfobacteriota bacterium]|nr:methyl-accepting chemotaxis protein [Thermodesulfobacteriota bacterium]